MRHLVTLNILYGLLGNIVLVSAQEAPEPPAPPAPPAPPLPKEKDSDVGAVTDKHTSCPEWAASGECTANPAYMKNTCSLSCASAFGTMAEPEDDGSSSGTCSPESIQDGTCGAPDASGPTPGPAPPSSDQPEHSPPDGQQVHQEADDVPSAKPEKIAAAGESPGSERIPDAPEDMSQHAAGSDADSPTDPSRRAEGERSQQNQDTEADGPIDPPSGVENPDLTDDPSQQADGTSRDGPLDHNDGPVDMTQQHGGTDPELGSPAEQTGHDTHQPPDRETSIPPPSEIPPHGEAAYDPVVDSLNPDMGVPPRDELTDFPAGELPDDVQTTQDFANTDFEDDHHSDHQDDHDDHHDAPHNDLKYDEDEFDEQRGLHEDPAAARAAGDDGMPREMPPDMPEAPEMPREAKGLQDEPPRQQEEARQDSSMSSTPTLQAGAASTPPAAGLLHEAVKSQAPLFDKSVVIAVHKVVLSLSSGCFELSKEASEFLSAALGGFISLPAPLSTIAVAFLFFLVALAFFRSLPTSFSAPVHEKSHAVKAGPVSSSPALSNDGLNALVKQVEALRQEVGSLSANLYSVSTENANAMLQLRQEMHSMHQERNQTDEELLLSVKEILECLHGDVDGADLNHCHPHRESPTSQPTASTPGVASMSPAEPAPVANTSMSSAFAVPAVSSPGWAPMPNMQSSGASMPVQVPAVASPVPAAVPQAQPAMPPAPAEGTAPVASPAPAPVPAPMPQAAAPPSMPFSAPTAAAPVASPPPAPVPALVPETCFPPSMPCSAPTQAAAVAPPGPVPAPQGQTPVPPMQAVPNTPPSAGPPPAVPQPAPVPPTSPLEAAGDFGKRQQQPIQASGNPFGARPQPKQPQASANPFGARPQPKDIPAVKGPFG